MVFQVRERARGNVTAPMMLWATVMAVVIFIIEANRNKQPDAVWAGVIATALFGIYLGWLWIAAMIHHGFIKGLFVGLFLVTIGWIGIGFLEFFGLGIVTFVVRIFRGPSNTRGPDVIVFGPDGL